jgi:hypothetical protein
LNFVQFTFLNTMVGLMSLAVAVFLIWASDEK